MNFQTQRWACAKSKEEQKKTPTDATVCWSEYYFFGNLICIIKYFLVFRNSYSKINDFNKFGPGSTKKCIVV